MSEQRAPQQNCPTSKRTATGTCGEGFIVHGVTHSCKLSDDHGGSHWCDCAASLPDSQPSPSGDATFLRRWYEQFKADDPHHCQEYEDQGCDIDVPTTYGPYPFETFCESMFVESLLKLRSHDAKVGQAEQRLRDTLRQIEFVIRESLPTNLGSALDEIAELARAALQESPSEPTR